MWNAVREMFIICYLPRSKPHWNVLQIPCPTLYWIAVHSWEKRWTTFDGSAKCKKVPQQKGVLYKNPQVSLLYLSSAVHRRPHTTNCETFSECHTHSSCQSPDNYDCLSSTQHSSTAAQYYQSSQGPAKTKQQAEQYSKKLK